MSINDVRRRAEEFEAAEDEYASWLQTRRAQRHHAPEGSERLGYAPQVQNGRPSMRWHELENHMRARGVWLVEELGEKEATSWSRRLTALSDALNRPERRPVGRADPAPKFAEPPP